TGGGGGKTLAVISPYYSSQPATKEVVHAFQKDAEAAGYKVTVKDTKNDMAAVNTEMETAVSQKVAAIVLGMGDPKEFSAGLAKAKAAKVPVIGLDSGSADGITCNVTSDNDFLGTTSAQALIDAMGGKGKVGILHFDPFEPVRLRGAAARKLFKEKGIEIIEDVQGDPADSTGFAKKTVLEWLTKYPAGQINGVYAAWDATADGAYQATQEANRQDVFVVGVDGQDFARAAVKQGKTWVATVSQDWKGIAAAAVTAVSDLLTKGTAPAPVITVKGELITKANA
ncbi:MAG TPA: substrate-binding domain-containing protein, partial [Ilumatobacteraceae bacterium]|nr:substrate-binding domain-containing protein [Ilumatobacteraceae bacterium]